MQTIGQYMDAGIKRGWVKTDAEIARKCAVSQAAVSRWRSGERVPEDEEVMVLAETIGEDPWEMLAAARYHKAKNVETKSAWAGIAAKMAASGITLCALIALGAPDEVYASVITGPDVTVFRSVKHLSEAPLSLPDFTRSKSCVSWPGIGVQPLPAMK